jgi:hypothetical protein
VRNAREDCLHPPVSVGAGEETVKQLVQSGLLREVCCCCSCSFEMVRWLLQQSAMFCCCQIGDVVKLPQRRAELLNLGTLLICSAVFSPSPAGSGWGAKRVDNLIREVADAHSSSTPAKILVRARDFT